MKKVLVLGGNGFIGRNLCRCLAEKGYEVYSFDMVVPSIADPRINYVAGDFFDDYTLETIVKDMAVIYHAICTLNPGNSNDKYIMGYERDFVQTVKLCSYIRDTGTKLIFLSSGGTVYGNQDIQPISESAVPVPINHYGNLKLCIENTLRTFNFQTQTNMLVARISNPYGPGQDYHKGVGFVDAVVKRALSNEKIEVWGDGKVVRDYIYIDDVCEMLISLLNYQGPYEVFNISSNRGISQLEIIEIVKQLEGNLEVEYKPARNVDARKIVLDNSRIKSVMNIELTAFEDGIRKYYEYVKSIKESE